MVSQYTTKLLYALLTVLPYLVRSLLSCLDLIEVVGAEARDESDYKLRGCSTMRNDAFQGDQVKIGMRVKDRHDVGKTGETEKQQDSE